MAFGGDFEEDKNSMSDINMTPLVDVMLVLLIIFIIAVPVITHSVKVDLPRTDNTINEEKPETIQLSVTSDGQIHWNETVVTSDELTQRLQLEAVKEPQPEVHIIGIVEKRAELWGCGRLPERPVHREIDSRQTPQPVFQHEQSPTRISHAQMAFVGKSGTVEIAIQHFSKTWGGLDSRHHIPAPALDLVTRPPLPSLGFPSHHDLESPLRPAPHDSRHGADIRRPAGKRRVGGKGFGMIDFPDG
ncbi:MAG: biopolymer transporter ExbD [Cytophagaceae bacterium]|nr:MAG: biopolymer transporter ExbD [Cytophagaceae bacterium]